MRFEASLPKRWLAMVLLGTLVSSCSDAQLPEQPKPSLPPPSRTADDFVHQAGVPSLHAIYQEFLRDSVEIFVATYGPPQDCQSGCFYSGASGLRLASKVGWVQIDDYHGGYAPDSSLYFEVTPADSALSDSVLWSAMRDADETGAWFWGKYLPLLAPDPDTPRPALLRLARMLYAYISPYVADRLLDNPVVQSDREILTLLANLPVFQGDAYQYTRDRAKGYLSRLQMAELSIER